MTTDITAIKQRLNSIPPRVIGMMHPMLHTLIIKDLPGLIAEIEEHRAKETELQEIIKNQWKELVEHRASLAAKERTVTMSEGRGIYKP